MAAYAFTFFEFRGKEIYFAIILGLMVIPVQIAVIPILQLFVWFGNTTGMQIIGQYPAAWIVHATFALPLAIYMLRNYMQTLPNALIEAARYGRRESLPDLLAADRADVGARAGVVRDLPVPVGVERLLRGVSVHPERSEPGADPGSVHLLGQYGQGWQRVAAGSFITLVVPLVIFFALQRYFVRGLTAGSVKWSTHDTNGLAHRARPFLCVEPQSCATTRYSTAWSGCRRGGCHARRPSTSPRKRPPG